MTGWKSHFLKKLLLFTVLLASLALGGCSSAEAQKYIESAADQAASAAWAYAQEAVKGQLNDLGNSMGNGVSTGSSQNTSDVTPSTGTLKVHFIDVGQGDSILIQDGSHSMLIDAGENNQGKTVTAYLNRQGISSLDYVIGTHPHSDHIGGLDDVLRSFEVKNVILPPVEHTTATFEDVLDAVADKGLTITKPVPGDTYELGQSHFTILGPAGNYGDELNDWSVGIRLTDGNHSFVMCGDAEQEAEQDMVNSGLTLSADVLKAGHHGSRTSSSPDFLKAVSPSWAVISCGKGNSYGHPHKETLEKYSKAGIQVLRTDELGTIIASSSPEALSWSHADASGKEKPIDLAQ